MWWKVATWVAIASSLYIYSCSTDPKREEESKAYWAEVARLQKVAKEEANAVLNMSCRTSVPDKYVQLKPLIPWLVTEGMEMRTLYIDSLKEPKYTYENGKSIPSYYQIDPNQLTITEQYRSGKSTYTRDVWNIPALPATIRFSEQYRKCVTDWKG